jgi:hypothetical protein
MKRNPINKGIIANKLHGVGEISEATVETRARELASLEGRTSPNKEDLKRARSELSGSSDTDRRQEAIESLPETARWDPVPGSTGREDVELSDEDEDEEGRNESAQLVDEGVEDAERDRMIQAEKAAESAEKRDRQTR